MFGKILKALFGRREATGNSGPMPTEEDTAILKTMNFLPKELPFPLDDLKIVKMQIRHMVFASNGLDIAMSLLHIKPPIDFGDCPRKIEVAVETICSEEKYANDKITLSSALGVLLGWAIISKCEWEWQAIGQNGWETLALCDKERRYLLLPIQFMREVAEGEGDCTHSPVELFSDVLNGRLPPSEPNALKRIC